MTHKNNLPASGGVVARFGIWASQHRARVVVAWVMLLIVLTALSHAVGTRYINSLSLGGTDSKRASDLLTRSFPAQAGDTDQVVFNARYGSITDATARARVALALSRVATLPHVTRVISPYSAAGARAISADRHVAFATVTFDERANDLPDFTHVLADKLPLFIGIILALAALLLLGVFRSLVIPIQAIVMNLLSVGASLGVIVAIFQWGWLGGIFGVKSGPIEAYIPVVMFAIIFGLSMDYEIFLISRIHEAWMRRRDATGAVYAGFASTGRVITAAATIMLVVFLSFVTGDQRVVKVFGLALASAVFLDAFVVRSLLLPSLLQLLGPRTWWLPAVLGRHLPHVAIDPPTLISDPLRASHEPVVEDAAG
jgi:putative drug exporter of the RND superfamily